MASPVCIALDFANESDVLRFTEQVSPESCRLKIGKELFTACGPQLVRRLQQQGFEIFLDLKYHDIPNTVAKAVKAAADLGVWMVNVHASGGSRMLDAARKALSGNDDPLLIAVTVLTSMEQSDLTELGISRDLPEHIKFLAGLTHKAGLDGVVCSAQEASLLRAEFGPDFCLVTPGIRPADSATDDQRRIVTPETAMQLGSSILVIGRPITQAADPVAALKAINASLGIN